MSRKHGLVSPQLATSVSPGELFKMPGPGSPHPTLRTTDSPWVAPDLHFQVGSLDDSMDA